MIQYTFLLLNKYPFLDIIFQEKKPEKIFLIFFLLLQEPGTKLAIYYMSYIVSKKIKL